MSGLPHCYTAAERCLLASGYRDASDETRLSRRSGMKERYDI